MGSPLVFAEEKPEKDHLESVVEAFLVSDPDKEKNLLCRGPCHLPKFSHRLTAEDLLTTTNVLEALAGAMGLFVGKDRLGRPSLGIDGALGQHRLLILIDGVRYNDPFMGGALMSFPTHFIDTIDIYYGPGGTWFGEGSLIGVVSITTKKSPGIYYQGAIASDQSLSGGMSFIEDKNRLRYGIGYAFSSLHQYEETSDSPYPLRGSIHNFKLKDMWARGFLDFKIKESAQTHLIVRSTVAKEVFDPEQILTDAHKSFSQDRLMIMSDVRFIKKRAQKNALDIFLTLGYFSGHNQLTRSTHAPQDFFDLKDHYQAVRAESGVLFHLKPWTNHDLYGGLGALIAGIRQNEHLLTATKDNLVETVKSPVSFGEPGASFGHSLTIFDTARGLLYAFLQDEWQIRSPILLTLGTRAILPLESEKFTGEFMPHIGLTLTPVSRLQLKLAYQTALRAPTFYEQSDRFLDALTDNLNAPYAPAILTFERSRSLEASAWYTSRIDTTSIKNGLSFHLTKLDDVITSEKNTLKNRLELQNMGVRSVNEILFAGGHHFSLGLFYAISYRKHFDEQGFPLCQTSFFSVLSGQNACKIDKSMPRFILRTKLYLDLLSFGGLTFSNSFLGMTKIADIIKDPYSLIEATYLSKPLWRYVVYFLTIKGGLGGKVYRTDQLQHIAERSFFFERLVVLFGVTITI